MNSRVKGLLRDAVEDARQVAGPAKRQGPIETAAQVYESLKQQASAISPELLEDARRAAVAEADAIARQARVEIDRFRAALERSFDEVMDRASGWYKRRVHLFLLVISLALVGGINADSFAIGQRLWKDKALRTAVVAQANNTLQAAQAENTPNAKKPKCLQVAKGEEPQTAAQKAGACVDEVEELGIPLGWSKATNPHGRWGWLGKVVGLLVTALALSLGAPFWFDLLGKVSRLKGAGPPSPTPEAAPLPAKPS